DPRVDRHRADRRLLLPARADAAQASRAGRALAGRARRADPQVVAGRLSLGGLRRPGGLPPVRAALLGLLLAGLPGRSDAALAGAGGRAADPGRRQPRPVPRPAVPPPPRRLLADRPPHSGRLGSALGAGLPRGPDDRAVRDRP